MVVVLLLLLVAGVERRMSQRGKGGTDPLHRWALPIGDLACKWHFVKGLFFLRLSLSLSLLLLVRRLIVFAAYLACLDWGVENHSES